MADDKVSYPYVVGTGKLVDLIKKIPDIGVPSKVTLKTVKGLGYTSSNDERFLPTLKFIKLLSADGTPSELWNQARGNLGGALAAGLKTGYSDLFQQYPNAHQKDDEALRTFFTVHSGTGKEAVTRMLSTFKALCAAADFGKLMQNTAAADGATADSKVEEPTDRHASNHGHGSSGNAMPVSISITLQLPPDATGEIYEKFFAAMAKHLPVK
jgi:hypothetical protein